METVKKKQVIVLVEDDEEDRHMLEEAARQAGIILPFCMFDNGERLLDFLYHRKEFANPEEEVKPMVVFLDLNLPRESGKNALTTMKTDPALKKNPVIVFTTSASKKEISWAYGMGANSIIIKPFSYNSLIDIMVAIKHYWFEIVELP